MVHILVQMVAVVPELVVLLNRALLKRTKYVIEMMNHIYVVMDVEATEPVVELLPVHPIQQKYIVQI